MDRSPERLRRLHAQHIERYESRLSLARSGHSGFREGELIVLLKLWREVEAKGFVFESLSQEAKDEVSDACYDEGDD